MRQYRSPALAALALTLALVGIAVLLWTQTASARLSQRLTGPALTTGQPPARTDQSASAAPPAGIEGAVTATPTTTPACGPTTYRVLIVYADSSGQPAPLRTEILVEPGVTQVDYFDALAGTPTLAQLQAYNIVLPFSNSGFADATTLGNNLADYVDGGGVVVQLGFAFYGPNQPFGINGRWATGNYSPYNYSTNLVFAAFTLGTFNAGHPLMQGVTALSSDFQNVVTVAGGATQVAAASNGNSLIAYRPVGTHTTVGITAYLGIVATQSGDWGKVIVNAGRWLIPSAPCGTATATITPTRTATAPATSTRTATAPVSTPTPSPTPTCGTSGGSPGAWTVRTPYPFTLYGAGVVSDGTYVYVSGGNTIGGSPHAELYRYDVATDTYTALASAPTQHYLSTVVYGGNGKIYDIAGLNPTVASNLTRIYDIASNTWSAGVGLPTSLYDAAGAYYNGKIYVMGGTNGTALLTMFIYDIATNTWTSGANLPVAEFAMASGVIGSKIYIAGGSTGSGQVNTLYIYDIPTNTWTSGATMGTAANYPAGAAIGGKFWAIGGGNPFLQADRPQERPAQGANGLLSNMPTSFNTTQIYDPATNTWTTGPTLSQPRSFFNAATVGNTVVVVGGYNSGTAASINVTEINVTTGGCATPSATPVAASPTVTSTPSGASPTPTCAAGSGTPGPWVVQSPAPSDFYGGAATTDGTYAYVAGAYSFTSGQTTAQFIRFNPATNAWTTLTSMPQAAIMASAVYAPTVNKIYVFGGQDAVAGTSYNITRIYDVAAGTWSTGATMPDVRAFMASGYYNGKIYLIGGYTNGQVTTSQSQTWEYDIATNTFATRAAMTQPLGGAGSAVVNGHLYVIGGRDGTTVARNQVYDYNIAANTWASGTNLPVGTNVPGSAVIGGKVWIFGGGNPFLAGAGVTGSSGKATDAPATTGITQIYDPVANSWSTGPNLNQIRSFPAGVGVGNYAVAVGGYTGSTTTNSTEVSLSAGGSCGTPTPTVVTTPTRTPTVTATPTCGGPSGIRILIVHADTANPPATLRSQLLALPGVTAVDYFDAAAGTPTLAQLQPYTVVVPMSNFVFLDPTTLGNNLADYLDGGGIVVGQTFSWFGTYAIQGRWQTGGYSPWNTTTTTNFTSSTLGSFTGGHPLMQGVTTLTATYRTGQTLAAGATNVALFTDNIQLIAFKGRAVGVNAYVGNYPYGGTYWTGDFARVILNAANWLAPGVPCTTGTPSVTRTNTPVASPTCASGSSVWRTETPLSVARAYAAGAVVNNQLYVVSGFNGSAPNSTVERFDPATNTWTTLSPIPTAISQARGAALGTKIYMAGGFNNAFGGQTTGMQIYDTATGLWSQGAPLPEARAGAGVAAANGKIYIIAGFGPGFATRNTVYEYDPVANTYATRAPAPAAEGNIAVGVLGSLIYAVGGSGSFMHYAYDPVANTWATIAAGPTPNHQTPGVFALAGELWVVGGTNGFNPYPPNQQVQIYNPVSDTWRFGPVFNIPRYGASAAGTINGRGYVAAGLDATSGAYLSSMESIAPAGACGTATPTATTPPTATAPPTATVTPPATGTPTDTPLPSATPRPASPTATAAPPTAVPTMTACPIYFVDVPSGDPFYVYVRCLTCRALLSGYPCGSPGEPCIGPDNQPYFRPNNDATRGQIAKILSNAAAYNDVIPSTQQTFEDVPVGSTFWLQIERIANRGYINGYSCGGPFEPCVAPGNRPYFRPYASVTRGQLSKMDALTVGWTETPTGQTFEDVPVGSTFYIYVERLATRSVIQGYPCGGVGEPCVAPGNRPYFRVYNYVTRAQTAKIIANSFFPNCQTPIRRP